jgi:cytochrome P450
MKVEYEPLSPRWREHPHPVYRRLRDHDPVHWAPESGMFCISRHADVSRVLKDPETFSSAAMNSVLADLGPIGPRFALALLGFLLRTRVNPFEMQRRGSLISIDPPRHDALRAIVNRGFVPRRIAAWEGRARRIVSDALSELRPGAPFDVIERIAVPVPVTIIAEMLGVEPERRSDFKRWSDAIIAVASGPARGNPAASGLLREFSDLYVYLRDCVRERSRAPADDLVSLLVDPSRKDALDELDVIQFVVLLLVAGNETTTNLIGNAVHALLEHEDPLRCVAEDPRLVSAVVEETLRYDSPIQLAFRQATREIELHGTSIPKDAVLALLLGSANRDERVFEDPDRFDIARDTRGHLAFGLGPHFCMGAALARLEARVALEALTPLLPHCKRVGPTPPWVESFLVRGRVRLEIERQE